jgi:hypothetical protein
MTRVGRDFCPCHEQVTSAVLPIEASYLMLFLA